MKGEGTNLWHCPLCGKTFQKESNGCSAGCAFGKSCGFICCPRCHYQFVEDSKTINWVKKIFGGKRGGKESGK